MRKAKRVKLFVVLGETQFLMEALEELLFQFDKLILQALQKLREMGVDNEGGDDGDSAVPDIGLRSGDFSNLRDAVESNNAIEDNSAEDEEVEMSHMVSSPKIDREPPQSLTAHNGTNTRKRGPSVERPSTKRKKLSDDAPRLSEADVQLQLKYMTNSFTTDEDSKLFKEYHIEKIKQGRSVIVSISPGESNGEFDSCVREFTPPKSGTQSASVDLSKCLPCRHYDDQTLEFCDSRGNGNSLCTQSEGKGRPTIFEHVETLCPKDVGQSYYSMETY
jgi:hypothetical protein